ncbi:MAG TPA: hypothetical protein VIM42_11410 [Clostridium sp.]
MEVESIELLGIRKYSLGDKIGEDIIGWINIAGNDVTFLDRKIKYNNSNSSGIVRLGYGNGEELLKIINCVNYIVGKEDRKVLLEEKLLVLEIQ